jgi:hypothetical protein
VDVSVVPSDKDGEATEEKPSAAKAVDESEKSKSVHEGAGEKLKDPNAAQNGEDKAETEGSLSQSEGNEKSKNKVQAEKSAANRESENANMEDETIDNSEESVVRKPNRKPASQVSKDAQNGRSKEGPGGNGQSATSQHIRSKGFSFRPKPSDVRADDDAVEKIHQQFQGESHGKQHVSGGGIVQGDEEALKVDGDTGKAIDVSDVDSAVSSSTVAKSLSASEEDQADKPNFWSRQGAGQIGRKGAKGSVIEASEKVMGRDDFNDMVSVNKDAPKVPKHGDSKFTSKVIDPDLNPTSRK